MKKILSLLTLLVLCATGAWAVDKTYAPTLASTILVQDNVLITGTYAAKKVANTSSVATFYVASGSYAPVSVISKAANIKSITITGNRDTGSNDNTVKAFNLLTSADLTTFTTPITGFTATKDNNGTVTDVTSLSDIPMVGNNQSYATSVTVTFDEPVMGIELTYSNSTSFSSISVTYDDAITSLPELCEAHATSTSAYGGSGCTVTADGVQSGVTIASTCYYNKLSSDAKYIKLDLGEGKSFKIGDEIWIDCNGNGVRVEGVKLNSSASTTSAVSALSVATIGSSMPMWVRCVTTAESPWKGQQSLYVLRNSSNSRIYGISVRRAVATETFTVVFNAGSNGICATSSLTEAEPSAGVTLPTVTPNSGYAFNGWFTAADAGTKVGDAGEAFFPENNITLYAQYSVETAPTISIDDYNPTTTVGTAVTLTATADGAPAPTVTWYQSATAVTSGGTSKGTGLTYIPDVSTEGTYYFYAVASNGVSPDATSSLITLTVNDPDKHVTGNAYFVSKDEIAVPDEQIFCDDITMTFVNGKAGESFVAGAADTYLSGVDARYVAQITGSSSNNGWKARFIPTVAGTLSVGVVINGGKTFSITNVASFSYVGKQDEGDKTTSDVDATNATNEMTPSKKLYVVVTIDVEAGKTYDFSVSASKMGFYGFVFTPASATVTTNKGKWASFTPSWNATLSDGAQAYIITAVSETSVTASTVDVLSAGTGYFVQGVAAETAYTATATADDATATTGNKIVGTTTGTTIDGTGNTKYVLGTTTDGVSGLFKVDSSVTVAAGKAYLDAGTVLSARQLSLNFDEGTTGITTVEEQKGLLDGDFYNVAGQRVAQPTKGLYIVSGKKIILK